MQSWINAQRRYCAGPRLDCARDASLEHQQNHGAARKQGKSTLWNFFFALFFLRSFVFALLFFLRKITIMASVSKLFLAQTDRMGTKFFLTIFFFFFPKPTPARKHESESRLIPKTNLISKELGLVVDIWWWYMAAVVVAVVVYGYGSVVVYGHGLVVVYGYGFGAVADKWRW